MFGELNVHAGGWTEERVGRLKKLWLEDGFSASQIASILGGGLTRNGVIGKVNRLKLSKKQPKARPTAATRSFGGGAPGQTNANMIRRRAESRQRDETRERQRLAREAVRSPAPVADGPELEVAPIPTGTVWQPLDGRAPVSLVDLGQRDCHWPLGDPLLPGFGYCGLTCAGDHASYCERHYARSIGRAA